jgi:NADH:ubiquinone oxidoreductase subunit 2 (subunit N)
VSSVIAAFLYLRIMVNVWMADEEAEEAHAPVRIPFSAGLAIFLAAAFTMFVGIVPNWLLDAAEHTTNFAK